MAAASFDPLIKELARIKVICESAKPPFKFNIDATYSSIMMWLYSNNIPLPETYIAMDSNNVNKCIYFTWKRIHPIQSELHISFNEDDFSEIIAVFNDKRTVYFPKTKNTVKIQSTFFEIISEFLGLKYFWIINNNFVKT